MRRRNGRQGLLMAGVGLCVFLLAAEGRTKHQAQQEGPNAPKLAKNWEFCAITATGLGGERVSPRVYAQISYIRKEGLQEERIWGRDHSEAVSKAIAKLGADGWRMVGAGRFDFKAGDLDALYFQRPAR